MNAAGVVLKKNKTKTRGHLSSGNITMEMRIVLGFTEILIVQQRIEIKREGEREEPICRWKI